MNSSTDYQPIRQWAEDDRPREKLMNKGRQVLSNAELLAILLGSGSHNDSALDLAKRVLASVSGNLIGISRMSVHDLMKFKGIGEAKAVAIVAALELGRRRRAEEVLEKRKISSSRDVFEYFQPLMADNGYEAFYVLLLNRANRVIRDVQISEGGMTGTVADPRKIFKVAIDHQAASLIMCHNHPSGNIEPSQADRDLTRKMKKAGELLDLPVLDHLIMGDEKYYSFADESQM
ncbi:MAG: DNA repair protein RadC [Bacteroidales bacterium]|nr:DNA repair protein RadC [Bacteroidales bacterium]